MYSGLGVSAEKGGQRKNGAQRVEEKVGVLAKGEQRHAKGIVDVFVQHAAKALLLERIDQRLGFRAAAKDHQLHKQPAVEGELPPVRRMAPLADIDAFRVKG